MKAESQKLSREVQQKSAEIESLHGEITRIGLTRAELAAMPSIAPQAASELTRSVLALVPREKRPEAAVIASKIDQLIVQAEVHNEAGEIESAFAEIEGFAGVKNRPASEPPESRISRVVELLRGRLAEFERKYAKFLNDSGGSEVADACKMKVESLRIVMKSLAGLQTPDPRAMLETLRAVSGEIEDNKLRLVLRLCQKEKEPVLAQASATFATIFKAMSSFLPDSPVPAFAITDARSFGAVNSAFVGVFGRIRADRARLQGEIKALRDEKAQKDRAFDTLKQNARKVAGIVEKHKADDGRLIADMTGICPAIAGRSKVPAVLFRHFVREYSMVVAGRFEGRLLVVTERVARFGGEFDRHSVSVSRLVLAFRAIGKSLDALFGEGCTPDRIAARVETMQAMVANLIQCVPGGSVPPAAPVFGATSVLYELITGESSSQVASGGRRADSPKRGKLFEYEAIIAGLREELGLSMRIDVISEGLCGLLNMDCIGDPTEQLVHDLIQVLREKLEEDEVTTRELDRLKAVTQALLQGMGKRIPPNIAQFVEQLKTLP
jgi:hypothetical protein